MFYTMIKLKNNKTKFIYTKSAGYINISCIARFFNNKQSNTYHINICNTLSTATSSSVISYEISEDEYKKLEDMFKE